MADLTTLPSAARAAMSFAADLEQRGDDAGAADILRAALEKYPDLSELKTQLALVLLRIGDFEAGWPLHEARPIMMGGRPAGRPALTFPEWSGEAIGSLLILPEQGLGDQIQYARYARLLGDRGVRISLMCHPSLTRLFQHLEATVISAQGKVALRHHDAWALGPSLPFRTGEMSSPPYLPSGGAGNGVGVMTAGNPNHVNNHNRSLPADIAAALLAMPNAISLHPEQTGAQDFEATREIIAELSLVISVDTAVAHLAGAMGKPCWLLLPFTPDWRWMRHRQDTAWYPSMRVFRQGRPGDWSAVIADVKQALTESHVQGG